MDPKQTIGFKKEQGEPEAPRRRIVTRSRSRSRRRISPDRRRSRDVRSPDRRRSSSWDSRPDGDGGWKREVYFVFGSAGIVLSLDLLGIVMEEFSKIFIFNVDLALRSATPIGATRVPRSFNGLVVRRSLRRRSRRFRRRSRNGLAGSGVSTRIRSSRVIRRSRSLWTPTLSLVRLTFVISAASTVTALVPLSKVVTVVVVCGQRTRMTNTSFAVMLSSLLHSSS